jgi:hypothetical protein
VPVEALIDINHSLTAMLQFFDDRKVALERLRAVPVGDSVLRLIAQVQWVALSSGLGNAACGDWLERSVVNDVTERGLEDILATAREVFWMVRRIDRQLTQLLRSPPEAEATRVALELAALVEPEMKRAWGLFSAPESATV